MFRCLRILYSFLQIGMMILFDLFAMCFRPFFSLAHICYSSDNLFVLCFNIYLTYQTVS